MSKLLNFQNNIDEFILFDIMKAVWQPIHIVVKLVYENEQENLSVSFDCCWGVRPRYLWNSKDPLTGQQIIEEAKKDESNSWQERSIFLFLNSLMDKKFIESVGFVRAGKTYARTFQYCPVPSSTPSWWTLLWPTRNLSFSSVLLKLSTRPMMRSKTNPLSSSF